MRSVKQLSDLTGRVALITGGAGHIGCAIGHTFAELGATVILLDRDEPALEAAIRSLDPSNTLPVIPLATDLENRESVAAVPDRLEGPERRLDILVHAAALVGTSALQGWAVPFPEQNADTWRRALEVNLTAPFTLTQACYPLLRQSGRGSVITVGSIYGILGPQMGLYEGTDIGNPAAYAASKGGLLQLTRWMATALAPKVRANCITLGGVYRDHQEPFLSRYTDRTPLRRMATEEDVIGAAAYLASDLSAYVTGHNLVVDGGWSAW